MHALQTAELAATYSGRDCQADGNRCDPLFAEDSIPLVSSARPTCQGLLTAASESSPLDSLH